MTHVQARRHVHTSRIYSQKFAPPCFIRYASHKEYRLSRAGGSDIYASGLNIVSKWMMRKTTKEAVEYEVEG